MSNAWVSGILSLSDLILYIPLIELFRRQMTKMILVREGSDLPDLRIIPTSFRAVSDRDGVEPFPDFHLCVEPCLWSAHGRR